jgi:hypothetical protein
MEEKKLKVWEEFEKEIEKTFLSVGELRKERTFHVSTPLFRGQINSAWGLKTTLGRVAENVSMHSYHNRIRRIKSRVESYTGMRWEMQNFKEPESSFHVTPAIEKQYEFMIYLRHHKFPSPLLDWTRSPYIAAFFAFSEIQSKEDVAIFVYIEDVGQGKSGEGNNPVITTLGPDITAHKRHHLQQCEYTICTKKENDKICYWDHEKVFAEENPEQDLLTKYILPVSEKTKVLEKLDLMNINAYSLFDTEESLMHTLTTREFFLEEL